MFNMAEYERLRNEHIAVAGQDSMECKKALESVKEYLDSNGYRMPIPYYKYDHEDMTTWKYLDVAQENRKTGIVPQILNPDFKYKQFLSDKERVQLNSSSEEEKERLRKIYLYKN